MKKIYLDYAATTPLAPEVLEAMLPYFQKRFGNPGSIHAFGQEAQAAVDKARESIAGFFGAIPEEIVFTGSATEANNLALRGVVRAWHAAHQRITNHKPINEFTNSRPSVNSTQIRDSLMVPHIVTTTIEHESVLETCRDLERSGEAEVTYVGVNSDGIIRLEELEKAFRLETILVSIMYANNEIGTIQPITEISNIIRNFRNSKLKARNSKPFRQAQGPEFIEGQIQNSKSKASNAISDFGFRISDFAAEYPLLHTDAVQAVQYLECNVNKLGVDLMAFSGHKIYGPKGIGGLFIKSNIKNQISKIITGGEQEYGFRSGTENVPFIVGLAKALEVLEKTRAKEAKRITVLRDKLFNGIMRAVRTAHINGSLTLRLPNNLNIYFPGFSGSDLVLLFDQKGVALSSGSACQAKSPQPSHVLLALYDKERAQSSIRISLGRGTSEKEIKRVLGILPIVLLCKTADQRRLLRGPTRN